MTTLVFLDTETTSLRPDRRAWDIAAIIRRPGQVDDERSWFVAAEDLNLGEADPFALRIGHFYERHPGYRVDGKEIDRFSIHEEAEALGEIEAVTRGAHLVGCVPNFDAEVLGTRMRAHGIPPGWHYHLVDVENLAAGYLSGVAARAVDEARMRGEDPPTIDRSKAAPPWDSEALSTALGVKVPVEADRHTAIGDARWARDMYDAVMGTEMKEISR